VEFDIKTDGFERWLMFKLTQQYKQCEDT